MYISTDLVVDLWDLVKDYLPPKQKAAIADEWLKIFSNHGAEAEVLAGTGDHESDFEDASEYYKEDIEDEVDEEDLKYDDEE